MSSISLSESSQNVIELTTWLVKITNRLVALDAYSDFYNQQVLAK